MKPAKLISLSTTPAKASQLCFEVGGILGESNVELGSKVQSFDFSTFYATLATMQTVQNYPAYLVNDFLQIQSATKPFTLAALRAEGAKATLHKAVIARANAYYAKYGNIPAIVAKMNEFYDPARQGSKPNRLDVLRSISEHQVTSLRDAYSEDNRTGVVKSTESKLTSDLYNKDHTISGAGTFNPDPVANEVPVIRYTGQKEAAETQKGYQFENKFQNSVTEGHAKQDQNVVSTDYGYRVPFLENAAQYHRAQISLIDEQFAQFMSGQNLPHLATVLQNELNSIESDIFQLQVAYLNTILMSPISGIVTGVYKYPGDAVTPGEPVFRVEDNSTVYLVVSIVYRGPISIGATLAIETKLFSASGSPTRIDGEIVSIRGQDRDDKWSVIAKCDNLDAQGNPIIPNGYSFDFDDTRIAVA